MNVWFRCYWLLQLLSALLCGIERIYLLETVITLWQHMTHAKTWWCLILSYFPAAAHASSPAELKQWLLIKQNKQFVTFSSGELLKLKTVASCSPTLQKSSSFVTFASFCLCDMFGVYNGRQLTSKDATSGCKIKGSNLRDHMLVTGTGYRNLWRGPSLVPLKADYIPASVSLRFQSMCLHLASSVALLQETRLVRLLKDGIQDEPL